MPADTKRRRVDVLLVERGLAETRERAQTLILGGAVRLQDRPATKPSQIVHRDADLHVEVTKAPYVSRGGQKLAAAVDRWQLQIQGKIALDVGASTGGFTDLLLQKGARRVYAVDVGRGQLDYRLRREPRVVVMEHTNVRYLKELPERPEIAVVDVSFISLRLALPPVFALVEPGAVVVTLIKPQFEAGRGQVGKGGVVRDTSVHRQVLVRLVTWSVDQPWQLTDILPSPLRGPAGNVEFLGLWHAGGKVAGPITLERALHEALALDTSASATDARARAGGTFVPPSLTTPR